MGVIIGMDPHKRSATIEVVDDRGRVLAVGRYGTDKTGYAAMLEAGRGYSDRLWAIEGCSGIGKHLWDGWDLFGDPDFKTWYDVLTPAIIEHEAVYLRTSGQQVEHLWFVRVNQDTGALVSTGQSELGSFYAGLLGQSGYLSLGEAYLDSWTSLLDRYPILPEGIDPLSGNATSVGNALRPEYVDSAFNLWLVTAQTERFRELAYDYYLRQKAASRVDNGWTIATNVTTDPVTHGDLTSGYWWSEQTSWSCGSCSRAAPRKRSAVVFRL